MVSSINVLPKPLCTLYNGSERCLKPDPERQTESRARTFFDDLVHTHTTPPETIISEGIVVPRESIKRIVFSYVPVVSRTCAPFDLS